MSFSKPFAAISTIFTASSPGADSISKNHFLCSSTRSSSSAVQVSSWGAAIQSCLRAPRFVLALSLFPPHLQWHPPLAPWASQSRPGGLGSASSRLMCILTSSHEPQVFLMASRKVNPFQKAFNLLCPDPSRESPSMAATVLWNIFLK